MDDETQLRALGLTCGIGSMLTGARQAGFDVQANIEWRRYYHLKDGEGRNTFTENFPGAQFVHKADDLSMDEIERLMGVELALGHPECGNFSNLRADKTSQLDDPSDIPLFVDLVARFQPEFFVMDDLPKSFLPFPVTEYAKRLPDYDLFPEWISNYHYGNPQKWRKRLFMIGAKKHHRWAFKPDESMDKIVKVKDVIGDLCDPETGEVIGFQSQAHRDHVLDVVCTRAIGLREAGQQYTWRDMRDYFLENPMGTVMKYFHRTTGKEMTRFGLARTYWDGHSHVITGLNPTIHPLTGLPFSIRERARIQGFPDDFHFFGMKIEDDLSWNHDQNNPLVRQTGKAMPVQFCRYVSEQVRSHFVNGCDLPATGRRLINANEYVDHAKQEYCERIGYADQDRACSNCWLFDQCRIRSRKYGIGAPVDGQPDIFAGKGAETAKSTDTASA
jgi:DNA (cytosine-5)-methyltransferase 1